MSKLLKNRFIFIFLGIGCVLAFLALKIMLKPKVEDSSQTVVKRVDLVQRVTVSGKLIPLRTTTITPSYRGYVKKIYVQVGQEIKANDPVISISPSSGLSGAEVFPMRAPFNGTVMQVFKSEGEYVEEVKNDNPLVRIDDTSKYFVMARIPELEIAKLKLQQGASLKFSSLPDKEYKGILTEISLASNINNRPWDSDPRVEYIAKIQVENPDSLILSGMTAIADLVVNTKPNVLSVPIEYVQKLPEGDYVISDNRKVKVKTGLQNDDVVEITEGISEGARVSKINFLDTM